MFGYIRPFKPELKIREFEEYKSYYCTLCKTLEKEYGFIAKFFLNYDFAFLALFLFSLEEEQIGFHASKCTFNPIKKCTYCKNGEETFKFVAQVSQIFMFYKVKDNIADEHFFKKMFACFLSILTKKAYQKAVKEQPEIDSFVKTAMERQNSLEKLKKTTANEAAEPSATLLAQVVSYYSNDEKQKRILYELGFHLGKWVYLIDALDDYKKDLKSNSFNPFIKNGEDYEAVKEAAKVLLEECITGYENAFLLLDIKYNQPILENILFEGNPSVYDKITMKERKCYE